MTNAGQPLTIEERLNRLETLFTNIGETVLAQNDTLDVVVANITQLSENVNRLNNVVDNLAISVNQLSTEVSITTRNIETLSAQAAEDRQQSAVDRQEFRTEIRQIWDYLRDRNGGSSTP